MSLRYNIPWVEHTFANPTLTTQLLSKEREDGNISQRDYDVALRFLPGRHRYYGLLGGLLATPIVLAFRKPSWSQIRTYTLITGATVGGFTAGRALCLNAHVKFVKSLEDPAGFSRALENIQREIGSIIPRGPEIVRPFEEAQDKRAIGTNETTLTAPSSAPTSATSTKPKSKWDDIRAANTPVKSSLWDSVRESHEKSHLSPQAEGEGELSEAEHRRQEQAAFDALLERERKLSQDRDFQ